MSIDKFKEEPLGELDVEKWTEFAREMRIGLINAALTLEQLGPVIEEHLEKAVTYEATMKRNYERRQVLAAIHPEERDEEEQAELVQLGNRTSTELELSMKLRSQLETKLVDLKAASVKFEHWLVERISKELMDM